MNKKMGRASLPPRPSRHSHHHRHPEEAEDDLQRHQYIDLHDIYTQRRDYRKYVVKSVWYLHGMGLTLCCAVAGGRPSINSLIHSSLVYDSSPVYLICPSLPPPHLDYPT